MRSSSSGRDGPPAPLPPPSDTLTFADSRLISGVRGTGTAGAERRLLPHCSTVTGATETSPLPPFVADPPPVPAHRRLARCFGERGRSRLPNPLGSRSAWNHHVAEVTIARSVYMSQGAHIRRPGPFRTKRCTNAAFGRYSVPRRIRARRSCGDKHYSARLAIL